MSFKSKLQKGSRSKSEGEKKWQNIASIKESKKGNQYFAGEDYNDAALLFMDSDGNIYKINQGGLFDPHEKAPDFILKNLVVDLNDAEAAELLFNVNNITIKE
jgi:hypothetical protein